MTPPHEMCNGQGCDLKEVCYRHKATAGKDQIYFSKPPMVVTWNPKGLLKGRTFNCSELWVLSKDHDKHVKLSDRLKSEDRVRLEGDKGKESQYN